MSAEQQTKILADYIMANVPGEPSRSEGAGDCAIRLLGFYRSVLSLIMSELGVPGEDYPVPVANAYEMARVTLGEWREEMVPVAAFMEELSSWALADDISALIDVPKKLAAEAAR